MPEGHRIPLALTLRELEALLWFLGHHNRMWRAALADVGADRFELEGELGRAYRAAVRQAAPGPDTEPPAGREPGGR